MELAALPYSIHTIQQRRQESRENTLTNNNNYFKRHTVKAQFGVKGFGSGKSPLFPIRDFNMPRGRVHHMGIKVH